MLKLYCPAEARCLPRPRHFPLPLAVPLNPPATPRVSESAKDQTTQKWTCQPPETSIQNHTNTSTLSCFRCLLSIPTLFVDHEVAVPQ